MPRVSVIIPTFNLAQYLGQAVESVLSQTYDDLELIVVDDGSTDQTHELVGRFGDRVRYLYQANQGVASARNAGIKAASGEFLAFLDADDVWLPEKLALQIPLLEKNSAVGLVYGDVSFLQQTTGTITGRHVERVPHPTGWIWSQVILGNPIPSPTPVVRRDVMEAVGGFDTALAMVDDWECWIRIARVAEIDCVGEPVALYRLHSNQTFRNLERFRERHLLVLEKVFRDPTLPRKVRALRRQALNHVYVNFGLGFFEVGKYRLAIMDLLQAVWLYPSCIMNFEVAGRLLLCVVGMGDRWTGALRFLGHRLMRGSG